MLFKFVYPSLGAPPSADEVTTERARLTAALQAATTACERLTTAIEGGASLPTVLAKLKERERERRDVTAQLAQLEQAVGQPALDLTEFGERVKAASRGWKALASERPEIAQAKLAKLLGGRLVVSPPDAHGVVTFTGQLSLAPLLAELKLPYFRQSRADVSRRSTSPTAGPVRPRRCASRSSRRPSSSSGGCGRVVPSTTAASTTRSRARTASRVPGRSRR